MEYDTWYKAKDFVDVIGVKKGVNGVTKGKRYKNVGK